MQVKLTFLGAAQNVTGSCHLVQTDGAKILVDCGLFQERHLLSRNWDPFPVPPAKIDAVLLTHAHLDHCGLLPKLAREGFKGPIICTRATAELAKIVLLDAARLQEEDAEFKRKRHQKEGRKGRYPEVPLYDTQEAQKCCGLFQGVGYARPVEVAEGMEATFFTAGHILGASMIRLKISRGGETTSVLFSGDVGRPNTPIISEPSPFEQADYVLVESTYGDKLHDADENIPDKLAEIVNSTSAAGGNLVIPSFAIERSQELLYRLHELLVQDRIPHLMVFMDSPMAIRVTEVFENHPELFDREMLAVLENSGSPFSFPGLKMTMTVSESKAINHIKGTVVIIAGSGMCTGGRIKHHLANNISRPESTILFVGYQAAGTLGRQIVDGAEEVRILGRMLPVRARVARLNGFSAHADRQELLDWLSGLKQPPRKVFVVHGEPQSARHFAQHVARKTGWDVSVPAYRDEAVLD